jgi:hypothetical protein
MDSQIFHEGEKGPDGMVVENTLNREGDVLPFGYFNPQTDGKLTWICGEGPVQKDVNVNIVSVFAMDLGDHTEKQVKILDNMEQALFMRDELVKNGWKKLVPPKIEFTVTKNGEQRPLNRRQKRDLAKKVRNMK